MKALGLIFGLAFTFLAVAVGMVYFYGYYHWHIGLLLFCCVIMAYRMFRDYFKDEKSDDVYLFTEKERDQILKNLEKNDKA